jgi:hypothetical protein
VIGAILAVVVAAVLMALVVDFASEQPDQVRLPGGDTFVVGDARRFARRIEQQRTPLFFKDPLTARAGRDIWVLHDGSDPEEGWYAIEAYAPGGGRKLECALQWRVDSQAFTDPCSGDEFDADDRGLRRYDAKVNNDGDVEVDLRS